MTSYAWQPGNTYGHATEPQYAALSYTWGRFRLKQPTRYQKLVVTPLRVHGIDWDIPRIDPRHFTTKEFKRCIQSCIRLSQGRIQNETQDASLEWVWVDVACIDQRDSSPEKASEVGRQAAIFKNAASAFVWINTHKTDGLTELVAQLQELSLTAVKKSTLSWGRNPRFLNSAEKQRWLQKVARREEFRRSKGTAVNVEASSQGPRPELHRTAEDEDWLGDTVQCLQKLVSSSDPKRPGSWFTSMWTLQETFLRPRALVLSKDGEAVRLPSYMKVDVWSLGGFLGALQKVCSEDVRNRRTLEEPSNSKSLQLLELIDHSGLAALYMRNPMAIYTIAKYRKPTREVDRVYGIMQVFKMQLGNSAPDADQSITWSLDALELQFCSELLRKHPVESQLCVHTEQMRPGHAWRMSASSVLPMLAQDLNYDFEGAITGGPPKLHVTLCTLLVQDTTWAKFSGKVIDFASLQQAWLATDRWLGASHRLNTPASEDAAPKTSATDDLEVELDAWWSVHQLAFDAGRFALPSTLDRTETPRGQPQRDLAAAVVKADEELVQSSQNQNRVQVMLLGEFCYDRGMVYPGTGPRNAEQRNGRKLMVGILVRLTQEETFAWWARLGVCTWDVSDLDEHPGSHDLPAQARATFLAVGSKVDKHNDVAPSISSVTVSGTSNTASDEGWRSAEGLLG